MAKAKAKVSSDLKVTIVPLDSLKPHPKNYREHPPDQVEHLCQSLRDHGWYRNIVAARDMTILAGHGIVKAALSMGLTSGPAIVLDIDPFSPRALKILAGDNEVGKLSMVDDRALTELLKEIKDSGENALLGTGFDDMMLAALVMVTRPVSEIKDMNEAAEWVGMPEYQNEDVIVRLMMLFTTSDERDEFLKKIGVIGDVVVQRTSKIWSVHWPLRKSRDDWSAVRFTENVKD